MPRVETTGSAVMDLLGILLALVGVTCQASYTAFQVHLLRNKICAKRDTLTVGYFIAGIILALCALWWPEVGLTSGDAVIFWAALLVTTLANLVIQYANNQARAIADVSLTAPISGMTPMLLTITALLLNEYPTPIGIAGIVLISLGTWIHSRENARTIADYLVPLRMLFPSHDIESLPAEERKQARNDMVAVRWSFLAAVFGSLGLLCDGIVARNGSVAIGFMVELLALSLVFSLFLPRGTAQAWNRARIGGLIGFGTLYALHALFIMSAFRFAPIAYVGSIKRFNVVIAVALGGWLLQEKKAGRRMFPALIITAGTILLLFDPGGSAVMQHTEQALRSLFR